MCFNKLYIIPAALILLMIYPAVSASQEAEENTDDYFADEAKIFTFKIRLKDQFTYFRTESFSDTGEKKDLYSNLSRIRFSPDLNLKDHVYIHTDIDNELITANYHKMPEFDRFWSPGYYNDLFYLFRTFSHDNFFYRAKVHTAYAKIIVSRLNLTIGRQQIRFGSGRLWNPLDILNPVSPLSAEGADEQKGTDAVRAEFFLYPTVEFSLVYDPKRKDDKIDDLTIRNSNLIGRFKTLWGDTEIAVLWGQASHRTIGGADISSIILDGTLRGAVIYNKPQEDFYGNDFFQAGVGYEYNFSFGLYFLLEYFYNQNAFNYSSSLRDAYMYSQFLGMNDDRHFTISNQIITNNQHYSGLVLGYNITPLIRVEGFAMYDFQGNAALVYPSLRFNIFQNIDFSAGVMKSFILKDSKRISDFEFVKKYPMAFASLTWVF